MLHRLHFCVFVPSCAGLLVQDHLCAACSCGPRRGPGLEPSQHIGVDPQMDRRLTGRITDLAVTPELFVQLDLRGVDLSRHVVTFGRPCARPPRSI
jgi:hypothetical protein